MLLVKALGIGFLIAAPVGPIGLLCMQRTLTSGLRAGLATGLGAATADAIYGAIGAFGFIALTSSLVSLKTPMSLIGAAFLIWLGSGLFRTQTKNTEVKEEISKGLSRAFASSCFLTLMNPVTVLSFLAVYATLMTGMDTSFKNGSLAVVGIFIGSALWWLTLSTLVATIRHRISSSAMRWLSCGSGTLLIGFGLMQLGITLFAL